MENKGNKIEKFICNYCLTVLSQSEKCTKCGSTLISTPRPQKAPSDRELALKWWATLSIRDRLPMFRKHFSSGVTCLMDLTEQDIENTWRSETDREIIESVIKSNQKQYKKFEPELFRAYIEKFSDEDKLKAFKVLEEEYILRLMFMDEAKEMDELNKI